MKVRLKNSFENAIIEVKDLNGGGDHIEVAIKYPGFKGMTRIEQHQAVMKVFEAELKTGELHALVLKTSIT